MLKRFILTLILSLTLVSAAIAAPFLICDPQATVTQYRIEWESGATEYIPAEADGSLRYDVGPLATGTSRGTLYAGKEYILDGVPQDVWVWSDGVPFDLGKPGPANEPNGVRLTLN